MPTAFAKATPLAAVKSFVDIKTAYAAGVTRVARVTGLDTAGVEVACAVRPAGHILQVSQGKGGTFAEAVRSAVFESFELWAAENPVSASFVWSTGDALPGLVWPGPLLAASVGGWPSHIELPWVNARHAHAHVWVPAQVVYCPPETGPHLGPLLTRWTSNGLGANVTRAAAVRHGQRELLEREAVCRVLPDGWHPGAVRGRRRELSNESAAVETRGFDVAVFDLTPHPDWPGSVAGVLLRSRAGGANALTAGYACRASWQAAQRGALFEAAQSRLTDVHGARDDVVQHRGDSADTAESLFAVRVGGSPRPLARPSFEWAVVDLPSPGPRVQVVRVLSPQCRVSQLF